MTSTFQLIRPNKLDLTHRKGENTKHNDGGRMETTRPPPLAHACSDFAFSSFRDFVILFGLPVATGLPDWLVKTHRTIACPPGIVQT